MQLRGSISSPARKWGSALSIDTARILGLYYSPQVSYGSSCTVLSDKFQFPSFLRTIPNDDFQSKAMANLVVYFGWTWVGTIAANDDYGKCSIKLFKEEVEKARVCISFSETLPKLYSRETILNIVETVMQATADFVVVFAADMDLSPLIEELIIHNITEKAWICDVTAVYDILNWQRNPDGTISYVEIGQYNSTARAGSEMTINNGSIVWMSDKVQTSNCPSGLYCQGEPVCCFDCIPCADGEISNETLREACMAKEIEFLAYDEALGITLIAVSAFGACIAIAIAVIFLVYRNTALVRANNAVLSFIQFSLVITFLSLIIFVGEPVKWSCMTRQVSLALGFCVCLSCIIGKTIVLMFTARAAKSKNPEKTSSEPIKPIHQRIIALTCILIHACACMVWLVLAPPYPVKNTVPQNIKILLECDKGSIIVICCIFGYDVLLALLGFVFTFMARKPPENFNKAKFVTFGMLVFFIVWISFVSAYLSTRGKFMVAVEIFAILASSFGLLACIFIPKFYIILLKPKTNTEALVRSKPKTNDTSAPGTSASITSELNSTTVSTVSLDG
ncbi:V2R1 protein, partial [Polyodon spathula]|nr:V2R1 protein [Polyodon spathula]